MSAWYWQVIALKAAFIVTYISCQVRADDAIQKLPFCNPQNSDTKSADDLVLVSTLDGKVTAFTTDNGIKAWDINTQPLLSSNLHHIELTSGGKWVRLVPSLRGALYSLSGDTVEPLPFTAEQLLSASFKYSDDLVIAGSRETQWMGVDAQTGSIVYECSTTGCTGDKEGYGRTLLALRRHSSTVRALDPRTGDEKWNFSVAEHNLALSGHADCAPNSNDDSLQYTVMVAPEGGLAVCKAGSNVLLWKQKLESPVAGMWRLRAGSLETIDVLWAATKSLSSETYVQTTPPSLYIGLHNQQLYVQEGEFYLKKMETAVSPKQVPWKLKNTRPLISGPDATTALQNADPNTLSLITLYGNTGQDNHGFFLYQEETCDQGIQVTEDDIMTSTMTPETETIEHHHLHVHVYSLWFWWKEVFIIALCSTFFMNLMIFPRFFVRKRTPDVPLPINKEYIVVEKHYDRPPPSPEYSGRYENDFTPLRCLGRGGFGVVFEARNNIDHCSYAVKRITLPRKESKRERVLREVRALAKLEHEHIVRYFNAWLEEPPPNWQEARDLHWIRELDGVSVAMSEETSIKSPSPPYSPPAMSLTYNSKGPVLLNLQKNDSELMGYSGQMGEPSKRNRSFSCNDSFSVEFDENAPRAEFSKSFADSLKNSLDLTNGHKLTSDFNMSKNLASNDDDDSFIVFANSEDMSQNDSVGNKDSVYNKQLEKVKASESFSKVEALEESERVSKDRGDYKKKGHRRHWSLDMCVKSTTDEQKTTSLSKMYLYIQMQLCLRDSLHDWLRQNNSHNARVNKVKPLFSQIVSAVEYVHLAGLIHRDLKPSNIFFAPDGKVKVGDFGLVTTMSDSNSQDGEGPAIGPDLHARHTYRVGTHLYMSPEQLRGRPYSYKVDIYSLGLILFELLQPFGTESERVNCLLKLREGKYPDDFMKNYTKEMELLKMMLSEDPIERPTASGVRAHAPLYQKTDQKWYFTLPGVKS